MGWCEQAHATWLDLRGLGRLLPGLPMLNPFGQWSCARLVRDLAARLPTRIGIVYERQRWTWKQIDERANQYAHFVTRQRLRGGDTVALLMDNRPEYLFIVAGLNQAGLVTALLNTNQRGAPLAHAIAIAKPKAIIVGREYLAALAEVLPDVSARAQRHVWVHTDSDGSAAAWPPGFRHLNDAVALCPHTPLGQPLPATAQPMCYIYTSGTTGLPKAAIVTNLRWIEAALGFGHGFGELTTADVLYLTVPLYHATGFCVGWGAVVASGATLALRRRFSASSFWDDVQRFNATVFVYIGELCRYLLNQPRRANERRHHLRVCIGNGLRADIWRKFQSRFRIPLIREFYGATEGNVPLFNLEGRPGMVGRMRPGVAVVRCDPVSGTPVRDANGRCIAVAEGEHGLLLGRINVLTRFDGYLDRAATRKKIVRDVFSRGDAYFNTGDVLQLHADGWLSFTDRVGDTFRWKGENVSTHQVAEVLNCARGLRESNVYGVPVAGTEGRAGMASVVVSPGFDLDAFAKYVLAKLPNYQRPYFLRVVPNMRVTATFKHRKIEYSKEGYDPSVVRDPLYFFDGSSYVPLDRRVYQQLLSGQLTPGAPRPVRRLTPPPSAAPTRAVTRPRDPGTETENRLPSAAPGPPALP